MKSRIFCFALLLSFFQNGCRKEDTAGLSEGMTTNSSLYDRTYLVFGRYAGEISGDYYLTIFKIEKNQLCIDKTHNYPYSAFTQYLPYEGEYVSLPSFLYNQVKDLVNKIPPKLLYENQVVIGDPDSYDQGGYYLEIRTGGKRKHWFVDTDKKNLPAYLYAFADTMKNYVYKIQALF